MEKRRYSTTNFEPEDKLEVSGRLHAPATLFSRKNFGIHFIEGSVGHSQARRYREEEGLPVPRTGSRTTNYSVFYSLA
jgi:hypothetical protein